MGTILGKGFSPWRLYTAAIRECSFILKVQISIKCSMFGLMFILRLNLQFLVEFAKLDVKCPIIA